MAKASKKTKKGKTPKELMKKHILDKNDIITEDEFKEMEVGTDIPGDQPAVEIRDDNERPKDEDKDPGTVTPWDVIT